MHIEKNFFESILNTIIDVHQKTKDSVKSRMDVVDICDREELHLQRRSNGKTIRPKAKFFFPMDKRKELCEWVKEFQMPDGIAPI